MSKESYTGTVIWFAANKGYGFIEWYIGAAKQVDLFCHFSDINHEGYKQLKKDQKVSFELGVNKKGQPKAVNIVIV